MSASEHPGPSPEDRKWLEAVVKKANAGDQKALRALRKFLDGNPHLVDQMGDLAELAARTWIDYLSDDAMAKELITRRAAKLRKELLQGSNHPVLKLQADTVVATWLEMHYLQITSANKGMAVNQANILLKRLDSAQRRHLYAMKQLTLIRELLPETKQGPEMRVYAATA